MPFFGLQNINRTFRFTWKPLNVLGGNLFLVSFLPNALFELFFAVYLVIASAVPMLLHFNLKKHRLYFVFSFQTTLDLFHCLFWGLEKLNTYALPWFFVVRAEKRNCYISVTNLPSKNISSTLFGVCLSLNMFFVPCSGISTWKYLNHICLVTVYALNTQTIPYFLFRNCYRSKIYFSHSTSFSFFCSLTYNFISDTYLVAF